MSEQLPIQIAEGAAFDTFEVILDEVVLRLFFHFNSRIDSWFMLTSDENDDVIIGDTRLVVDWPLLAHYRDLRLPPGTLILVDTEELGEDPTFDSLGTRHVLTYFTAQDLLDAEIERA